MEDEQRKTFVIGGVILLLCFVLLIVCCGRGNKSSGNSEKNNKFSDGKTFKKESKNNNHSNYQRTSSSSSSYSSSSSSASSPSSSSSSSSSYYSSSTTNRKKSSSKSQITDDQRKRILAFQEKARKEQQEWIKEHIKKLLENPNTPAKIKIKAQLMENKNYVNAYKAHKNHDYKSAISSYLEVLKDKNSSPETQYITVEYLLDCAQFTGDLDLFLKLIKIKGTLMATEDLSVLNVEKSDTYLKWTEEFTDYMKARSDPSYKDELIDKFAKRTLRNRSDAERVLNDRIVMYENLYKDLLKL